MNNIIKNIKKFSTFTIAFTLLASQLTACGNTAQTETESDENEAISIEVSTPLAEEEQGTENELTWVELALLETNPEIRSSWENTLGITGEGETKEGMLYVNAEGTQEPNNTLQVVLSNEAFRNALTDSATSEALINAVMDYYEDVEDGETEEALMMGINAYFNLLPDSADNYANAYSPLTRSEFMALVMRSDTAVDDELTVDQDFKDAVGNSKYNRYAQEVADNSYLDIASGSLNEDTYNSTITRAEAVYIVVSRYFSDELAAVDISNAETYSDVTNAGNIAEERGYSEYSQSRAAELEYMLENPEEGMTEELYKAMVVAYDKGLLGDDEESRWDEGITKVEAVSLVVNANLASESAFNYEKALKFTSDTIDDTDTEETEDTSDVASMTSGSVTVGENEHKDPSDNIVEEPEQESAGVEIIEELDLTMYATVNCNARTGDGTNYDKAAFIELGAELHVTGKTANGWYRVVWSGAENNSVYILGDYLSTVNPYASTATATETSTTAETSAAAEASTTVETSTSSSTDTSTSTETSTDTSTSTSTDTSSTSSSSVPSSLDECETYEDYYNYIAAQNPTWDEATVAKTAEQRYLMETGEGFKW